MSQFLAALVIILITIVVGTTMFIFIYHIINEGYIKYRKARIKVTETICRDTTSYEYEIQFSRLGLFWVDSYIYGVDIEDCEYRIDNHFIEKKKSSIYGNRVYTVKDFN